MVGPEPTALPLGYSPMDTFCKQKNERQTPYYPSEKGALGQDINTLAFEVAADGDSAAEHAQGDTQ